MPNWLPLRTESATSAACNIALVGMQPRCKQVPPTLSLLHQSDGEAQLGCAQGAGVAAAAGTEDDEIEQMQPCRAILSASVAEDPRFWKVAAIIGA